MKVLLIDNSELVLQRLHNSLIEGHPHIVVQTCNVPSLAFRLMDEFRPDLVVFEIRSSAGFNFDDVKAVKQKFPQTILIMFTHFVLPHYKARAESAGVDYFYLKSRDFEHLVETVGRIVQRRDLSAIPISAPRELV